MADIVLIHGYGTWRDAPVFLRALGSDAGFFAFRKHIDEKKAVAFRWGIHKRFHLLNMLNIFEHIQLYFAEKKLSEDPVVLQDLKIFLENERPKIIICHSMGCYLLSNYLALHPLPENVQHIVLVQADLPRNVDSVRTSFENTLHTSVQQVINFYCHWDITLWAAAILNGYLPAGLFGLNAPHARNIFYPLLESVQIHNSSMRSQRFLREIERLCC